MPTTPPKTIHYIYTATRHTPKSPPFNNNNNVNRIIIIQIIIPAAAAGLSG